MYKKIFKEVLNEFLNHYHNTPHSSTGKTPAELFFGRQLRTSLDLIHKSPDEKVELSQDQMVNHGPHAHRVFNVNDAIYYETRNPLEPHASNFSIGTIIEHPAPKTYKIQTSTGDIIFRHEDQIKSRQEPIILLQKIRDPNQQSTSNV